MPAGSLPNTLGASERRALDDYASFLRDRFGPRLRLLRLFGSRARGTGHEDSDLDVLVVVDGLTSAERRAVWEFTGDLLTAHDQIVGGMAMSTDAWNDLRARERRIVTEIDRDGVDL